MAEIDPPGTHRHEARSGSESPGPYMILQFVLFGIPIVVFTNERFGSPWSFLALVAYGALGIYAFTGTKRKYES